MDDHQVGGDLLGLGSGVNGVQVGAEEFLQRHRRVQPLEQVMKLLGHLEERLARPSAYHRLSSSRLRP